MQRRLRRLLKAHKTLHVTLLLLGVLTFFIRGILHRDCLNVLCTPLGSQSHAVHHPHRMRVEDFKVAMGLEGQSAIAGLQHVKVPSFTNGGASHSSWMDCMLVLALL